MSTIAVESRVIEQPHGRTLEHLFFSAMSIAVALVVVVGFARTYYLAGLFGAKPLPALVVHVHGAVFTSWFVLLVTQSVLVGTGHARRHRRLGLLGLVLAPLMVVLGAIVAVEMLHRMAHVPHFDAALIFAVALSEIVGFGVPILFAFRFRRTPAVHKRLILIGTIATTTAGFGRWPIAFLLHRPLPAMLAAFTLLFLMVGFDLLSTRRVHRATLWAGGWVATIELGGFALGHTALWHVFAEHVRALT